MQGLQHDLWSLCPPLKSQEIFTSVVQYSLACFVRRYSKALPTYRRIKLFRYGEREGGMEGKGEVWGGERLMGRGVGKEGGEERRMKGREGKKEGKGKRGQKKEGKGEEEWGAKMRMEVRSKVG